MAYMKELAKALKDDDPLTRERVANALKELEDPRATMPLVEALGDPCGDVRRAAALALSWVGDERAGPALIGALEDKNDSVRLWAASGLRRVGDESAVEALIKALSDPYDSVREQAVLALAKTGDNKAVKPLLEALDDKDVRVQEATRFTLRETFGVDVGRGYEVAERLLSERNARQHKLNLGLEKVLKAVRSLGGESCEVLDEDLYQVLSVEHGIDEDEAIGLIVELIRAGLVYTSKPGYTKISV